MREWVIGLLGVLAALVVTATIVFFGADASSSILGFSVFLACAVFAYAVQWIVFVHAWVTKSEMFYDLTGSATYIVMVMAAVLLSGSYDAGALVIATLIVVWALRLGPFLYLRVKRAGEDRRFRKLKYSWPMFFMTWTLQATWVFVTACCALAAITGTTAVEIGMPFWCGLLLWVFGFGVEVIADRQKSTFRSNPANAQQYISTGLWAWSRHPNYFGEIVLWLGIALMAYESLSGGQLVTLISPVFVVVLLTFVSGVRMLEIRGQRQWGEDPEYQAYCRQTPALMLWPPRRA